MHWTSALGKNFTLPKDQKRIGFVEAILNPPRTGSYFMKKRVGITTDTEERKQYWESQYNIRYWKIVKGGLSYEQAQNLENMFIAQGYEGSAGGAKQDGNVYSVYVFGYYFYKRED